MQREVFLLAMFTMLAFPTTTHAQVVRNANEQPLEPLKLSAEAHDAVRATLENRSAIKARPNELQEFALEFRRIERVLALVVERPSVAHAEELHDQARRIDAALEMMRARASRRADAESLAPLESRRERLSAAIDAIVAADTDEDRAMKAAELLRDLTRASSQRQRLDAPTLLNAMRTDAPVVIDRTQE